MFAGIVTGGFVAAVLVISYCCVRGGIKQLFYGLRAYLLNGTYLQITPKYDLKEQLFSEACQLIPGVFCFMILTGIWLILKERRKLYQRSILAVLIIFYVYGIYKEVTVFAAAMIYHCFYEGVFAYFFLKDAREGKSGLVIITICSGLWYVVSSVLNIYGFGLRQYILTAACVMSLWMLYLMVKEIVPRVASFIGIALAVCFTVAEFKTVYGCMYRDEPIEQLTCKVEDGIWKGCYTTEERKDEIFFWNA